VIALLLAALLAAPLKAAAPKKPAAPKPRQTRTLKLDTAFTVEGHIQKPTAFFILPRGQLELDAMEKKESFLPKIVKSVEKDPF